MTINEIIELLERVRDDLPGGSEGDLEVLLVTQPAWPLQFDIHGVYLPDCDECEGSSYLCPLAGDCPTLRVYLVAGDHPSGYGGYRQPYGPKEAWEGATRVI